MVKRTNRISIIICIFALLTVGLSLELHNFMKTTTKILAWDYDIASEAFSLACDRLDEGEMTERQILKETATKAFKPIWQTRDLTKPIFMNDKWYAPELHEFLFNCSAADNLTDKEVSALISKLDDVSRELNKMDWETIWIHESWAGKKSDIYKVIQNTDRILK